MQNKLNRLLCSGPLQHTASERPGEWKVFWVAGVATLRIIGHVLAKVDAASSAVHKAAINRLWGEWKDERAEHMIFWDFIEEERDSILKFRDALYWWRAQLEELESKLP